jgi:putative transposase
MFLGISRSKFYQWCERRGQENQHNGKMPRDFWITEKEKQDVLAYYAEHSVEGYRAVTYMMMDENVAAMSCSSVYRILSKAGVMRTKNREKSKKGEGFEQPLRVHEHWHTDISYLKIMNRFYFFIGVLDGCSRYLLHWEIRETMTEHDVEVVLQRTLEKYKGVKPRLITDNGSQYTSHEFKQFVALHGLTHVRTSPYYPQSNGKMERFHFTLKLEGIRPGVPLSVEDARRITEQYVNYYNNVRLHSAIGFIPPKAKLEGREGQIFQDRKEKLKKARQKRLEAFAKCA